MSAPDGAGPGKGGPAKRLARALAAWDRVERTLVGLLGAAALAIAVVQVFGRYLDPGSAINWAEEVIVYLAVWAVMLVSSQLVRTDSLVRPDLVLRLLPAPAQRWVETFNCLVAMTFTAGMVWYGWQIVASAWLFDQRSSSDLQFPMWAYYLALPVGGGLMLIRYAIRLVRYLFLFDPAKMTIGHVIVHEAPADLMPSTTE
jgi:C4-dicarboxylate transporter, DctQ subunit